MEIERIASGELNRNIEQCVSILMDVERRVHALKSELVTTLGTIPRTAPTSGFPTNATPVSAPNFQGVHVPNYGTPFTTPVSSPWFQGWTGVHNVLGLPTHQAFPTQNYPLGYHNPLYTGYTGFYTGYPTGYPSHVQGFNPLVQGMSPISGPISPSFTPLGPVQNFGYIW